MPRSLQQVNLHYVTQPPAGFDLVRLISSFFSIFCDLLILQVIGDNSLGGSPNCDGLVLYNNDVCITYICSQEPYLTR